MARTVVGHPGVYTLAMEVSQWDTRSFEHIEDRGRSEPVVTDQVLAPPFATREA